MNRDRDRNRRTSRTGQDSGRQHIDEINSLDEDFEQLKNTVMPISKEDAKRVAAPSNSINRKYIADLMKNCYDAGDFLTQLPVPRDGAFFILHFRPNP